MEYLINKEFITKAMRKKNIHSQKELAEKINITPTQLSNTLSPTFNPIKSNICKICDYLEIDASKLIERRYEIVNDIENDNKGVDFVDTNKINAKRNYTVLELFAGAGGLALGLEQAGFSSIGLVEIDKYAAETLRINRPEWNVIEHDLIKITEDINDFYKYVSSDIELDLLSGGYPCQSFSYAGKRLGLEDTRGTLFYNYAKVLEAYRPKMFLVENVKGLVTHDEGRTLKTMISVFENIGYTVKYEVLNALDYGVAEKRQRIIIVGVRNDLKTEYNFPKKMDYQLVLKNALVNVPDSPGILYSEKKKKVMDLVPPGGYWRDLPVEIAKEYMGVSYYSSGGRTGMARRISWDEPSLTLTTSPSQKQTERCHPDETRPFTTREYARIQSFPDEWIFYGSVNQVYKQIGNAVAVNFAKHVGLSIIDTLNRL